MIPEHGRRRPSARGRGGSGAGQGLEPALSDSSPTLGIRGWAASSSVELACTSRRSVGLDRAPSGAESRGLSRREGWELGKAAFRRPTVTDRFPPGFLQAARERTQRESECPPQLSRKKGGHQRRTAGPLVGRVLS